MSEKKTFDFLNIFFLIEIPITPEPQPRSKILLLFFIIFLFLSIARTINSLVKFGLKTVLLLKYGVEMFFDGLKINFLFSLS